MSHFQPGPFDVSADDLSRVSPSIAVSLVHQLLVAEAQQIGVPITAVNVPSTIYVADGGVDAEVSLVSVSTMPLGLLREGHTRYQIKSGSFQRLT
jgi:NAD(P)H-hydrate repair Nnr-like enzyme with NAD(P)H-hydrate epimerase domain